MPNPTADSLRKPEMPDLRAERGRERPEHLKETAECDACPQVLGVHRPAREGPQEMDQEHLHAPDPGCVCGADSECADIVLLKEPIAVRPPYQQTQRKNRGPRGAQEKVLLTK